METFPEPRFIYRITLTKYSFSLVSPGTEGRWNSKGYFMIYTAGSRALACLENLVHRNSEGLKENFKVLIIKVPSKIFIPQITEKDLPPDWYQPAGRIITRTLGNDWLRSLNSSIIKVPSAIIKGEYNFLLNPGHKDFEKFCIHRSDDFFFDNRLKQN